LQGINGVGYQVDEYLVDHLFIGAQVLAGISHVYLNDYRVPQTFLNHQLPDMIQHIRHIDQPEIGFWKAGKILVRSQEFQ